MIVNEPFITITDLLLVLYEDKRAVNEKKLNMDTQEYILFLIDKIKLAEKSAKKEKYGH